MAFPVILIPQVPEAFPPVSVGEYDEKLEESRTVFVPNFKVISVAPAKA